MVHAVHAFSYHANVGNANANDGHVAARIAQLEQQKSVAASSENYTRAHQLKMEINQLKSGQQQGGGTQYEAAAQQAAMQRQTSGPWPSDPHIRLPSQGIPSQDDANADYPQFVWDQRLRQIVDIRNPQVAFTHPDHFRPNPKLNHWKPGSELHEMERRRCEHLQEIQGLMYEAISKKEQAAWPINGINKDTPWGDLTHGQKALALVEQSLTWSALRQKSIHKDVAKDYMGLTLPD